MGTPFVPLGGGAGPGREVAEDPGGRTINGPALGPYGGWPVGVTAPGRSAGLRDRHGNRRGHEPGAAGGAVAGLTVIDQAVDALGQRQLPGAGRGLGAIEPLDRSKSEDLRQTPDRLKQRSALGAKVTNEFRRTAGVEQPGPAGDALVVGHQGPLSVWVTTMIPDLRV